MMRLLLDPKLYRYTLIGGTCALIDVGLFFSLRHYFSIHYLLLATFAFLVATLANYLLCEYFVFKNSTRYTPRTRIALTYMVSSIGLCLHHSCLFLLYEWYLYPLLLSKIIAMGFAFGWNFFSRKHFVFSYR